MLQFLTRFTKNHFVNLPIKSKYYHKQLPTQVTEVIKMIKRQSVLNQKCFLIQHLTDLVAKDRKIVISVENRKTLTQQINKWKDQKGRFQHIATVAWVIKRLNLQKIHQDLFTQIKERFLNDEWYVNFDQSVKALQVFKSLPEGAQKYTILNKIQRNIGITMWNVNMKHYERISTSLLEAGRYKSELWERMQNQILQNLGMEYETKTVCNIFKAYALSQNGDNVFYQMMQKVLFQGHFDQYNLLNYKNFSKQYDDSGQFFSLVIETYALASKKCGVVLTPQFKDYVYDALMDAKTQYKSLGSLTKAILSLQNFQFQPVEVNQIQQVLLEKRPNEFSIGQIKQFYEVMQHRHGKIPERVHQFIQEILIKDIKNKFISASETVDLVNFLIQRQFIFNQKALIVQVNKFLENSFKYLHADQAKYVTRTINQLKSITNRQDLLKIPDLRQKKTENLY